MWRNCPGRRRQQTRQTTVSTDMAFMENFEPMNRWIVAVSHGISEVFWGIPVVFTWTHGGTSLKNLLLIRHWITGHCWTLLDTGPGNPWKSMEILKPETYWEITVPHEEPWWAVLVNGPHFYLIFESSCYAFALACRLLGCPPVWPAWSCFLVWTAYIDTLK